MAHPNGTVVTLVSEDATRVVDVLRRLRGGGLRNVDAVSLRAADAGEVTARLVSSHATYIVDDADPLEHVASAWVEFFDDRATIGTLEAEVDHAVDELESGRAVMPDYYLVLDPESLAGTWRHWWLGVLPHLSPSHVVPTPASVGRVGRLLSRLPTGRTWPKPGAWLRSLEHTVPDQTGLAGA